MSLYYNLPDELLRLQLSTWLTIVDVACLDSALCCTGRRNFERVAYRSQTVLQYGNKQWGRRTNAVTNWILEKGALVSGIYITPAFVQQHQLRKVYLEQNGAELKWVEYACDSALLHELRDTLGMFADDIVLYCPNLTKFDSGRCQDPTAMLRIVQGCPLLEELVCKSSDVRSEEFEELSAHCPKLKRLELNCRHLDEQCLIAFVEGHPDLLSIDIRADGATDEFVHALAESCRGLTSVTVREIPSTKEAIYFLMSRCRDLASLSLIGRPTEWPLEYRKLDLCANMRELYLYMQHAEEQDLCTMLDACPGLTALTVRDNGNNLGDLNALLLGKRCPNLQKLTMSGMMGKVADDAALLNVAENCADLRVLQIPMNNDVTDASLIALAEQCPLLEEVNVTSCMKVTDASLFSLSQHSRALKTLLVAGCPLITDAGVTAVMQCCPALVELKLGECRQVSKDVMRAVDVLNNTSNSYWE